MKHFIFFLFGLGSLTGIFYSCKRSFLNSSPLGSLSTAQVANKQGVEGLLIGAYSLLDGQGIVQAGPASSESNWIYGSICGTEAYTGGSNVGDIPEIEQFETFTSDANNDYLESKWQALYEGVQSANDVIRIMRLAKDMTTADTIEARAEALFLRAFYHFEAKKVWNNIPYIDETITYAAGDYHVPNDTSWTRIENDFTYAMNNLPPTQPSPGRVNKYAAEAFLAKAYMFAGNFQAAEPLLKDVISNGVTSQGAPYALLQHYHDIFDPAIKNGTESVFAAQMSVNDGSAGINGNYGDVNNFPYGQGPGLCCGFFQPSQYLVNHFKTDSLTGLPDLDNFNDADVKNDGEDASDSGFVPHSGTLDPRLDWTAGRTGIPYLDWGIFKALGPSGWVRDPVDFGPYTGKKNAYFKSEQQEYTDNSFWAPNATATNFNLIRFADVLLLAAETEIQTGNLEVARGYINQVRQRAADPSGWVYQYEINPSTGLQDPGLGYSNVPAANYKVGLYLQPWTDPVYSLKAVRYERVLELGMEGHRFFDLVRWGIAQTEIDTYLNKEQNLRIYLKGVTFAPCNEYFPIPQTEIDLSAGVNGIPMMKQNCY
jgi:hypothetical protein